MTRRRTAREPGLARSVSTSHNTTWLGRNRAGGSGQCGESDGLDRGILRTRQTSAAGLDRPSLAPPIVQHVLNSPGQPLDQHTRASFEPRFSRDFSHVRVHADSRAADSATAVNALAYTVGHDVVFGGGQYAPNTVEGRSLLAHELTHVAQNTAAAPRASNPILMGKAGDRFEAEADERARVVAGGDSSASSPGAITPAAEPNRLSRATMKVGPARVEINYGNLLDIHVADFESAIETRFASWTGTPATAIHSDVTALSSAAREWVLFALDLLVDNPVAGLDKVEAVRRLIAYAPRARFRGLGTASVDFEKEAMTVSGWFEKGITAGLSDPTGVKRTFVQNLLNTGGGGGSSCPSSRSASQQLDAPKLESDLPPQLEAYLKTVVVPTNVKNQPMAPLLPIADQVQAEARAYYAPYADKSRGSGNTVMQQWQYSAHLVSSQSSAGTPNTDLRSDYLNSRARIVGDKGLFAQTHFDPRCDADDIVLDGIVKKMEPQTTVRALVDPILRQKSYTRHAPAPKQVVLNPQVDKQVDDCEARWKTIRTMCHELMHVMSHDDYRAATRGRMILVEGIPEVLGHYLYEHVAKKAGSDTSLKAKMEAGLSTAPCSDIPSSTIGYPPAGPNAEKIRIVVKNDNFRAAFFLGQLGLIGIQPKRANDETAGDPREIEAESAARAVAESRSTQSAVSRAPVVLDAGHLNAGPGRPLDPQVRREMQGRLGYDFSRVRVHTDSSAASSATAIGALAYTVGRDIVFGAGQYAPGTRAGWKLIAHELTHVAQQGGGQRGLQPALKISSASDPLEQEADRVAESVVQGGSVGPVSQNSAALVQRKPDVGFVVHSLTRTAGQLDDPSDDGAGSVSWPLSFGVTSPLEAEADVEVTGVAGDPCASHQVGFLQTVHSQWLNFYYWGRARGDGSTVIKHTVPLPIRDGNVSDFWYSSHETPAGCGVRVNPIMSDSPVIFTLPKVHNNSRTGQPNHLTGVGRGIAFVTTLVESGPGGVHPLRHFYWNYQMEIDFTPNRAAPTTAWPFTWKKNRANLGAVHSGADGAVPIFTTASTPYNQSLTENISERT